MNNPKYSSAITDALFILLPFFVLFLIKFMQSDIYAMFRLSDYSLAISIMYGQLLGKTLNVHERKKKYGNFQLFQVIVFIVSILSIVLYAGFQLVVKVPDFVYTTQLIIFVLGVFFYIPIGTLVNKLID